MVKKEPALLQHQGQSGSLSAFDLRNNVGVTLDETPDRTAVGNTLYAYDQKIVQRLDKKACETSM